MIVRTDVESAGVPYGGSAKPLPPGYHAELGDAGSVFYRYAQGPTGAPTVVLLHGWTSTADVTWHGVFNLLSRHYSVIAPDLRGHGHGPSGSKGSRLPHVASDVAGLIDALGIGPVILVGYSMGGAAAQIVARERPDLLLGMVICASASPVCSSRAGRLGSALLRAGSMLARPIPDLPLSLFASAVMRVLFGNSEFERWVRSRTARNIWSEVLSLGADMVSFDSRDWIGALRVPSAVVVTTADRFVSPHRQHLLATSLDAPALCVDGDHSICLAHPVVFGEALLQACDSVISDLPVHEQVQRTA